MFWNRNRTIVNLTTEKQPITITLGQLVVTVLLIAALGFAYYFYDRYHTIANKEEEAKRIVSAVASLIILPSEELPTIATVTDPKALEGQPFFDKAEVGDKVLVYADAKKAILYRPSVKKIVEVMPFAIPENIQNGK